MGFLSFIESVQETAIGATTDFIEFSVNKTKESYDTAVGATTDAIEGAINGVNAVNSSSTNEKEATETVDSDSGSNQGKLSQDPYKLEFYRYPIEIQSLGDKIKHWIEIDISDIESETLTKESIQNGLTDAIEGFSNILSSAGEKASEATRIGENAGGDAGALAAGGLSALKEGIGSAGKLAEKFGKGVSEGLKGMITTVKKDSPRNKLKAKLAIYMPDTIYFNQRSDYSERGFDQVFGKLGQFAQIGSGLGGAVSEGMQSGTTSGMVNSLLRNAAGREAFGTVAGAIIPGSSGENFSAALLKGAGYALNPQVELFFTGVDRRTFQFDFRFNSRSSKETEQIQGIIKTLRKYAAPTLPKEGTGRYFIPPSIFDISFAFYEPEKGWKINDKLPKISRCVLESIDINYNGTGKYITYEDGQPIDIEVRLMFKETDIMTRSEIEAGY